LLSGPSPVLTMRGFKSSRWAKAFSFTSSLTRPTCWLSLAFLTTANPDLGYKEMWLHADTTIKRAAARF